MAALLPNLVSNVLLCLPVRSFLRFRCLSKSSCADIDSADFIKNHLKRSVQSNASQKLIIVNHFTIDHSFYFADFDDNLQHTFPLNGPLRCRSYSTMICGSCNGLILLGTVNYINMITNFAIWNPFTRRYKKLPLPPSLTLNFIGYGLGYDYALDDFKVVLISKCNSSSSSVSSQVWIFSLKSNSWRHSPYVRDVRDLPINRVGLFANGALCWENVLSFIQKLVGFDLTNEVFFDISKLPACGPKTGCFQKLMVLGGKLYSPRLNVKLRTVEFYLLVSDKGEEVAGKWRKEFSMPVGEITYRDTVVVPFPLAYSEGGDSILLLVKNENSLFWYNLEKKTNQRVEIGDKFSFLVFPTYFVISCETLVFLGYDSAFDGAADDLKPF